MSRKYRQAGYQDDSTEHRDAPEKSPPRRRENLSVGERHQKRGLRLGLDRNASEVVRCHVCSAAVEVADASSKSSRCPKCAAALHCCRLCKHFDSGARWQCRADIEAPVEDKIKANDCVAFSPRKVLDASGRRVAKKRKSNDPKAQFDALFKS